MTHRPYDKQIKESLKALGISTENSGAGTGQRWLKGSSAQEIQSLSPADGHIIARVSACDAVQYEEIIAEARKAFPGWRALPAPRRGEIVRQIGNRLREYKHHLGILVSYEMGKIYEEGMGEVQEMIDICDFAVGLSRQLYGLTMHSERTDHRMYEQWHPLGIVGIISAFNFPVAVYSWNAFLAAVCGNVMIWKPSEKTPLCAVAVQNIIAQVLKKNELPEGIFNLAIGDAKIGQALAADENVVLVSATGSVGMGRKVGQVVAGRLGKTLLELGGNNGIIISPNANLELALKGIVFGAVGTAGQRCTSTRRLIIHDSIYDEVREKLVHAYQQLRIGHPLDLGTLVGPLIDQDAVKMYLDAIEKVKAEGGIIAREGEKLEGEKYASGCFVSPCIAEADPGFKIVCEETFAPLLYLMKYSQLEEAIRIHNDVPQGLSSAIFTNSMQEAELFLSSRGSDCGIANVNIGTSGAEIGGAFGGEKNTGGGRESGSDSWKSYMRRQTNTINWSKELPLAQGIEFVI
ncbi:MAG: aldehyde dehydrogenase family protein [Bacteroidia bacterium]